MLVTNNTIQDYWFGPLHLLGGIGQTLTVDDTTATSLYLLDDSVADAINNLSNSGKITCTSTAAPFPRPTGVPSLLHGDGSPEGLVFAPQGSVYLRRDGTGANSLYTKTTGVTINTGWENYTTTAVGPGTTYRKTTTKAVTNTTTETDLLNGEITLPAGVVGATGIVRVTAWGDAINNMGSIQSQMRFKLKMGAGPTVLLDTGAGTAAWSESSARDPWVFQAIIAAQNATNVQAISASYKLAHVHTVNITPGSAALTTGEGAYGVAQGPEGEPQGFVGFNAAALDMTVAQGLLLTVILPVATATIECKLYGALVEII